MTSKSRGLVGHRSHHRRHAYSAQVAIDPAEREVLLVEYQDSAEHHDNLVGNVTSLWLGSAIFIGFVLSGLTSNQAAEYKPVLCLVIALGMFLTVLVGTWARRAGELKKAKYARCKQIERLLGMKQHLLVGDTRTWQGLAYMVLLLLLLLAWVALFVDVVRL
jgi:hypothetical protein